MNINLTLIGQTIMFAMFVWFCMKFIWPPIIIAMEARKKRIEDGLEAARLGLLEQKKAKEKAQVILNKSKDQAIAIIDNAGKRISIMITEAKNTAAKEADKIKNNADIAIKQDIVNARNELREELSTLVIQGVNSILTKEVDEKTHKDMLNKLAQML